MNKERLTLNYRDNKEVMNIKILVEDSVIIKPYGYVYDTIYYEDGSKKIIHNGEMNMIVDTFKKVVTSLLSNHIGYHGILYMALGQGEHDEGDGSSSSWDSLDAAQRALKSATNLIALYDEIARITITTQYLDGADNVTEEITNKLKISASIPSTIQGYLREFALFGGNATDLLDSGLMLNHKAHEVIPFNTGDSVMTIERALHLVLL